MQMQIFRPAGRAALMAVLFSALAAGADAQSAGQFEIDEEAAERALERALVESGSVLLAPGSYEIVPFFTFERDEDQIAGFPALVDEELVGTSIAIDRTEVTAGFTFRAGLPWRGQIDLTVPYVDARRDEERRVLGSTFDSSESDIKGLGDVTVSYTQALTRDAGAVPAVLASLTYGSDTGKDNDLLFTGTGFEEVTAALTTTVRQDPLVFVGRLAYQRAFENNGIQPGDQISLDLGTFLSVNPETSLQIGLGLSWTDDLEINGDTIDGSDQFAAALNLGVATVLRRNTLLDTTLSLGLTDDAPEVAIAVSLPIRLTF